MSKNRKMCSKNCGETCTEWSYNAIGGDNFPVTSLGLILVSGVYITVVI
jgi:hypothetical protein